MEGARSQGIRWGDAPCLGVCCPLLLARASAHTPASGPRSPRSSRTGSRPASGSTRQRIPLCPGRAGRRSCSPHPERGDRLPFRLPRGRHRASGRRAGASGTPPGQQLALLSTAAAKTHLTRGHRSRGRSERTRCHPADGQQRGAGRSHGRGREAQGDGGWSPQKCTLGSPRLLIPAFHVAGLCLTSKRADAP